MRNVYKRYEKKVTLKYKDENGQVYSYTTQGPYKGREQRKQLANILVNGLIEQGVKVDEETKKEIGRSIAWSGLNGKEVNVVKVYDEEKEYYVDSDFTLEIEAILVEEKEKFYPSPLKKVLRPNEEFNGFTPQDALDYIKSQINVFECDDERMSDAVKRLQQLIDEAK